MKKLLLLVTLACSSLSANVYDGDIFLTKSSSKKASTLDAEFAHNVSTYWYMDVYAHRAFYTIKGVGDVTALTVIEDRSGLWKEGYQYIGYSNYPYSMISVSNKKSTQKINSIKYTVYDHGEFKVYSTDGTQFYIYK